MKSTMEKGSALPAEYLPIIIFLAAVLIILVLIYASVTSDSPGYINTFVNRILDNLLEFFA